MNKPIFTIAAAIAAVASAPASAADYNFNFSGTAFITNAAITGSGVITTNGVSVVNPLNGYTEQTITGITGTFNGSNITGLANPFGANNLYYLSGPFFVDGQGLGFTTASNIAVNLFVTNGTSYRVNTMGAGLLTGLVTASASPAAAAVPEPATWGMMLLGFGAMGYAMRRRAKVRMDVSFA